MSIQEHLNKIRNAIYGREVRESIAKGIETAYDDASEKHDNANMEVKIARGTHPNLRSRLEEVDNKQQQTTAQLAQKTDKGNVSVQDINKNLGKFDGSWFTDEFNAELANGTLNVTNLLDGSVTDKKLADNYLNGHVRPSLNLFDMNDVRAGYYIDKTSGYLIPYEATNVSGFIPIDTSEKELVLSGATGSYLAGVAFYASDSYETFISGFEMQDLMFGVDIPSNANFIVISPQISDNTRIQLQYGTEITEYEYHNKNYLSDGSIKENHLSFDIATIYKPLKDSKILIIGDSITWLDGKNVTGVGEITGFQESFRKLGASVTSKGNSGATIAQYHSSDTGQHGSLYDDIVTANYDVSSFDKIVILAGTNDVMYKQGNYGEVGEYVDSEFDTTTTLGALRGILEYLSTKSVAEIHVFTPFYSDDLSRSRVRMLDINDKMNKVCDLYNINCVQLYTRLGINKINFTSFFYDGTHPNNNGMKRLGDFMVNEIPI